MTKIQVYSSPGLGRLENHTRWEPPGGTGVYRRSLYLWRNFTAKWTACDLLIFLDGQNLFSQTGGHAAFNWAAESQFSNWERPLLVAGIPATRRRYPEYIGWSKEPGHYSATGPKHARFLVKSVLPYLKSCHPKAKTRGLVGASAGGVAALYTAWSYPGVFPAVGCLSAGRHYFQELLTTFDGLPAEKIYLSCGDRGMDRGFLPENRAFLNALKQRRGAEILNRWHRGNHTEKVWARRIPDLLQFIL